MPSSLSKRRPIRRRNRVVPYLTPPVRALILKPYDKVDDLIRFELVEALTGRVVKSNIRLTYSPNADYDIDLFFELMGINNIKNEVLIDDDGEMRVLKQLRGNHAENNAVLTRVISRIMEVPHMLSDNIVSENASGNKKGSKTKKRKLKQKKPKTKKKRKGKKRGTRRRS